MVFNFLLILIPFLSLKFFNWFGFNLKFIYLSLSVLFLFLSSFLYLNFNFISNSFQYLFILNDFLFGLDGISLSFVLLTLILIPLFLLSNWYNVKSLSNQNPSLFINLFFSLIFLINIIILFNFWALDYISFYILFELTLPLLFMFINLFGSSDSERASFYVLMFTLTGSLFMLVSILFLYIILDHSNFLNHNLFILSLDLQCLLWLGFFIAILIKTPLFPLHVWLPLVHSESPLGGSMVLAGLILKLALYSVIRLILPSLSEANILYTPFVYLIALLTIIYSSLAILRQIDLKVIIAYSSISHMAIAILGLFSNTVIGIHGALSLAIAHAFVSPALFLIVGGILYDRYHIRIIHYYKGLTSIMPQLATYLLLFSFANIATPLTLNFIGEFFSLQGAFIRNPIIAALASFSVLFAAIYQLKLTSRLTGGSFSLFLFRTNDVTRREALILNILAVLTVVVAWHGIDQWKEGIMNVIYIV